MAPVKRVGFPGAVVAGALFTSLGLSAVALQVPPAVGGWAFMRRRMKAQPPTAGGTCSATADRPKLVNRAPATTAPGNPTRLTGATVAAPEQLGPTPAQAARPSTQTASWHSSTRPAYRPELQHAKAGVRQGAPFAT
ncbi:hypothetical protein WH91_21090, partial [Devosia psychrophila]